MDGPGLNSSELDRLIEIHAVLARLPVREPEGPPRSVFRLLAVSTYGKGPAELLADLAGLASEASRGEGMSEIEGLSALRLALSQLILELASGGP